MFRVDDLFYEEITNDITPTMMETNNETESAINEEDKPDPIIIMDEDEEIDFVALRNKYT